MNRQQEDDGHGLFAVVARGANSDVKLFPHKHADGSFVVSMTRFQKDYIWVPRPGDLPGWLHKGFALRMSNPSAGVIAPSLISAASVRGWGNQEHARD